MTYKLLAGWTLAMILMSLLNSLAQTTSGPASSDPGVGIVNSAFGIEQADLDEVTAGEGAFGGVIGMTVEIAKQAKDFIGTLANALFLNYDYFKGDMAAVRMVLLALSGAILVMVAKDGAPILTGMVRGLFAR